MGLLGKKKEIGLDTIIQRRSDLLFNEIDGEVVLLSVENGEYYGMDQVGTYIWKLLEYPHNFKYILNNLINKFDVTEERCKADTSLFLDELMEKRILIIN